MEPIRIKTHNSDFTFSINGDRLKGTGKVYLEGRQEFSFPLAEISPEPSVLERRHPLFRQGLIIIFLALIAAGFFRLLENSEARIFVLVLMGAFVVAGLLISLVFLRPYRYLTFLNRGGVALFGVTRTPMNSEAVDRLIAAIRSGSAP